MSTHQNDSNASALWLYFNSVITRVQTFFEITKRNERFGMGVVFNQYSNDLLDSVELETKISTLMADKEVTKKSGLYEYLLSGKEKYLNLRQFDDEDTRAAYEHQKRVCPICGKRNDYEKIHAYHITSWHADGSIILENI